MEERWVCAKDCCLCGKRDAFLGKLLGPIGEDRATGEALFVHRLCAIWSPEVYQTNEGTIKNFKAAFKRGRGIKCVHCGKRGATIGCVVERCQCSYHLACAKAAGCHFLPMRYLLSCPDHSAILTQTAMHVLKEAKAEALGPQTRQPFIVPTWAINSSLQSKGTEQPEAATQGVEDAMTLLDVPPGGNRTGGEHRRGGKRKRGGREREIYEHVKAARTALNRFRAARKLGLHPPGYDSDEEWFAANERARYAQDREALRGTQLGAGGLKGAEVAGDHMEFPGRGAWHQQGRKEAGQEGPDGTAWTGELPAAPSPSSAPGWEAVGGLADAVRQLKEMVLLPLAYPVIFQSMGLEPPRGILLHGSPGCGKTLLARALYGACQKCSDASITFFSRKGADCLGEFAGDAERNIRILFEEAANNAPSIIFLDELDALVPSRGSREGGSDQMYASVVTTLLSVMDGVQDRGNVVVIGATNRPDSIDAALRRPGRFDREVYVGLPSTRDRRHILRVQTRNWERKPSKTILRAVAASTEGFAGADLASLCTAAVMSAIRRRLPDLADLLGNVEHLDPIKVETGTSAAMDEKGAAGEDAVSASDPLLPALDVSGGIREELERILADVQVTREDWTAALRQAPAPCSLRQGVASLAADAAAPVPYHAAPILLPFLAAALSALNCGGMDLPGSVARAVAAAGSAGLAAGGNQEAWLEFEAALVREGAVEGALLSKGSASIACPEQPLLTYPDQDPASRSNCRAPLCRLLLVGEDCAAQSLVAGAILQLASGGERRIILGLPQMLDAGAGDLAEGAVALVRNAVMSLSASASLGPLVLYLPHLEAWALDVIQVEENKEESTAEETESAGEAANPSPYLSRGAGKVHLPQSPRRRSGGTSEHHETCLSPVRGGICPLPSTYSHDYFAGMKAPRSLELSPAAARPVEPTGGGDTVELDAARLTPLWHTVEATISQLCAGKPVIIIGTCGRAPDGIPQDLLHFFNRSTARPQAEESSCVVDCSLVSDAASRGTQLNRQLIASRLGDRVAAAAAAEVTTSILTQIDRQIGHRRTSSRETLNTHVKSPPLRGRTITKHGKNQSPDVHRNGSVINPPAVNEATLAWGRKINIQVQASIRIMGFRLLQDRRAKIAKLPPDCSAPKLLNIRGSLRRIESFSALARVMAVGRIDDLQALLHAVSDLAFAINEATPAVRRRRSTRQNQLPDADDAKGSKYMPYKACAASLKDDLEAWGHALRLRLGLSSPAAITALAAAQDENRLRQRVEEEEAAAAKKKQEEQDQRLALEVAARACLSDVDIQDLQDGQDAAQSIGGVEAKEEQGIPEETAAPPGAEDAGGFSDPTQSSGAAEDGPSRVMDAPEALTEDDKATDPEVAIADDDVGKDDAVAVPPGGVQPCQSPRGLSAAIGLSGPGFPGGRFSILGDGGCNDGDQASHLDPSLAGGSAGCNGGGGAGADGAEAVLEGAHGSDADKSEQGPWRRQQGTEAARLAKEWGKDLFEQLRPCLVSLAGAQLSGPAAEDPLAFLELFVAAGARAGRQIAKEVVHTDDVSSLREWPDAETPGGIDSCSLAPYPELPQLPHLYDTALCIVELLRRSCRA